VGVVDLWETTEHPGLCSPGIGESNVSPACVIIDLLHTRQRICLFWTIGREYQELNLSKRCQKIVKQVLLVCQGVNV